MLKIIIDWLESKSFTSRNTQHVKNLELQCRLRNMILRTMANNPLFALSHKLNQVAYHKQAQYPCVEPTKNCYT